MTISNIKESPIKGLVGFGGGATGLLQVGAATDLTYVENVFSTDIYTGNGTSGRAITNNINLTDDGGMVWIKCRDSAGQNWVCLDTERGASKYLQNNNDSQEQTGTNRQPADGFTTTGFKVGTDTGVNGNTKEYASWTFRKATGFFDIVKYDGTGSAHAIEHKLGCKPGMILVKSTDLPSNLSADWAGYHKSTTATHFLRPNDTIQAYDNAVYWNDVEPTSTHFTVGTSYSVNHSDYSYVAYLFADGDESAAQIFGTDGDEKVIKCGTYEGTGADLEVDVGFEPQWILLKNVDADGGWYIFDIARGTSFGDWPDNILLTSSDNTETITNSGQYADGFVGFTSNGFMVTDASGDLNSNGQTFIYMAIRRPMKPASEYTAEELYDPIYYTGNGSASGNSIETSIKRFSDGGMLWLKHDGNQHGLILDSTGIGTLGGWLRVSEGDDRQKIGGSNGRHHTKFYSENPSGGTGSGFLIGKDSNGSPAMTNENTTKYGSWSFKRSPKFFDVVSFRSSGSSPQTVPHNLGVVPEFMIITCLTRAYYGGNDVKMPHWVYHKDVGATYALKLDTSDAKTDTTGPWNDTAPTATHVTIGSEVEEAAGAGEQYVVYMWASLPGVSKVGNYTGNGGDSAQNIDCGFSSSARFVLIKNADATGNWQLYDSARGFGTGTADGVYYPDISPEAFTDTVAADSIATYSSGFTVSSGATRNAINQDTKKIVYLAIA